MKKPTHTLKQLKERLIVELDEEAYNNSTVQEYDAKHDSFLEDLGYIVLRFENKMVFENLTYVLLEIEGNFKLK